MAFSLERRQMRIDGEILEQRMNIGPIVVQSNPPRVGVPRGRQSKPVLDFAFLPVQRRQFGGKGRKRPMIRRYRRLQDQESGIPLLFEYIIVEKDSVREAPVLGEQRDHAGLV